MRIDSFDFSPGKSLNAKYEIVKRIGKGWEGEVYLIKEQATDIERVAKFFFPHRNQNEKASNSNAQKLYRLSSCRSIIKYLFQNTVQVKRQPVSYVVSEYVDGVVLSELLKTHPGKRLHPFEAVHLLFALLKGLLEIHALGEHHGDLHTDNIIVRRIGLGFEVKLIDLQTVGYPKGSLKKNDIIDLINVFYEVLGGKKQYAKLPSQIRYICCGLKHSLILERFPTLKRLLVHIETMSWS